MVPPLAPIVTEPLVGEAPEKFVSVTSNIIPFHFSTYFVTNTKSWSVDEEDDQVRDDIFMSHAKNVGDYLHPESLRKKYKTSGLLAVLK